MNRKVIEVSSKKVILTLCIIFCFLFALNVLSLVSIYLHGVILKKIDFNHELNIPTYHATVQLLIAGYLIWWISVKKFLSHDKFKIHWRGLSLIFYFLAADEFLRLHDKINESTPAGWVKYYLVLSLIVGSSYLFFLKELPKKTRNLMILAGGTFVTGAIGFEVVGAYFKSIGYGTLHIYYRFVTTTEESLEFIAIIIFIYTLLDYINSSYGGFSKKFKNFDLKITE